MDLAKSELAREKLLLVRLTMQQGGAAWREEVEALMATRLDWHWVISQALKHKVLHLIWDQLVTHDLLAFALDRSGLPKLLVLYMQQLAWLNGERNLIFLEAGREVVVALRDAGVPAVALKGLALIGVQYHPRNRMLHDLDIVVPAALLEPAGREVERLGFQSGVHDPATGEVRPMAERQRRFWTFYNHTLPAYFRPTGAAHTPFVKLTIGFDFFDRAEAFAFPSDLVSARAVPKADGSGIYVPCPLHMFFNLCAHIFREGVSAVFAQNADNWQLTKLCDLRTFALGHLAELMSEETWQAVQTAGLAEPVFYALHHTALVYGDEGLRTLADRFALADRGFLDDLIDGSRRARSPVPFEARLFETRSSLPAEIDPTWYKAFANSEW